MSASELHIFWETHADMLTVLSLSSIVMFVSSVLLVPYLILRAPADVFVRVRQDTGEGRRYGFALFVLRNALGLLLLVAGVLMLVLPGQGLLTIACALCLMDLPFKRELLRSVVARPPVWKALAWIRTRGEKAPFEHP